ncbi:MAG: hypothetical protein QOJ85_1974 [Solirubrobacteraceae bacterium]|nr:hypothetical protein [Solirubrobacteraceae bacterium]
MSTFRPPGRWLKAKNWSRWSWSTLCVIDDMRTSETEAIDAASGVSSAIVLPCRAIVGALVIAGRGPLKRYGGE